MTGQTGELERLRAFLAGQPALELAILVGSRADSRARKGSDWDIAIQWPNGLSLFDTLARSETLRRDLAAVLGVTEDFIDLIDLPNARLAMRAAVAEDGVPLQGEDSLAWNRFLARTWRELEDYEYGSARVRLDLYQAETAFIAREQGALLDEARSKLVAGEILSGLEQNGVLHALQVLIGNAIGKSKQMLKAGEPAPVSAYDAFAALARRGGIPADELPAWNAVIGLRNRIVHDYMNIDMARVLELVQLGRHEFVTAFLLADPPVG
ncbi:MAG: DUF86 domain-containing protein [Sulfuritalea sp.]|nr:DUF86 domain-containing protein [Sulfuritalea sp.]